MSTPKGVGDIISSNNEADSRADNSKLGSIFNYNQGDGKSGNGSPSLGIRSSTQQTSAAHNAEAPIPIKKATSIRKKAANQTEKSKGRNGTDKQSRSTSKKVPMFN